MKKLIKTLLFSFTLIFSFVSFASNNTAMQLTAMAATEGKIDLTWNVQDPTYWFQIRKSYNGEDFFNIANVMPGSTQFTNSQLFSSIKYWYQIIVRDKDGNIIEKSNIANAMSPSLLSNPYPLFQDNFDAINFNQSWYFLGGSWRQKSGLLEQIDHTTISENKKAILKNTNLAKNHTILAKIRVTGWRGAPHVGVGLLTNELTGEGYELVFHHANEVQFLHNGVTWGNAYTFPWEIKKWYWFKLRKQDNMLLGKIWADGTEEPNGWGFQQDGWTDLTTGYPALDGGSKSYDSIGSAVFDDVSVYGALNTPKPFAIGGNEAVNPNDFEITTFASNLNYPHGMQELPDHSILVATSDPGTNGNYFNSVGTLLRLQDSDDDGVADATNEIKYTGLPGTLTALQVIDNLVFVTSSVRGNETISILRMGEEQSYYTLLDAIKFKFPSNWDHRTYALAVRKKPNGTERDYELFFNVGSQYNEKADTDKVTFEGLTSGIVIGSSIYRISIHDNGTNVTASDLRLIADGLRNAAGLSFHKETGDLYLEDNGIDDPDYANEPLSADTLHLIPKNKIGNEVVHFGFPDSYIKYRTNKMVGPKLATPLAVFQPWSDFYAGDESEGPSEIAIAPHNFPAGLKQGVFVGFHGRFNLGGIENEENPLVFYNSETREYFHFIGVNEPNVGHLDGLLSTDNALFAADLCKTGNPANMNCNGMGYIYKIKAKQK